MVVTWFALLAAAHRLQSLWHGNREVALVEVNLILPRRSRSAFAAEPWPDGRCKTFDERADGYVRGEGRGSSS